MSSFQRYWDNLRENKPETYEQKLKINRERIAKLRKSIYEDPELHEQHKKRQRELYRKRVDARKMLLEKAKKIAAVDT